MSVLRITVNCFSCNEVIEKNSAIQIKGVSGDPRFECFSCFKKKRTAPWGMGDKISNKNSYYCQKCRYKFQARRPMCPYCSKADYLTSGNLSVHDLL